MNSKIYNAYIAALMILPLIDKDIDVDDKFIIQEYNKGTLGEALSKFIKEQSDNLNAKSLDLSFMNEMDISEREASDSGFNKMGLCYVVFKLLAVLHEPSTDEEV